MVEPIKKMDWAVKYRKLTDYYLLKLPLPKVNPNIVSGLSVVMALIAVLLIKYSLKLVFIFLLLNLVLDWLDGLIAKKYNMESEEGYICDTLADRLSEGIIFIVYFNPWFYFFALNCLLTLISCRMKKHIVLPLRHIFLIYFLIFILL